MSSRIGTVVLLAGVAGAAFVGGRITATSGPNAAHAVQPEAQAGPPTLLTPEHERLSRMLGDWEGTVRVKMGGQWSEWPTEIERESAMNGLFVLEQVESDSDMGSYRGMGVVGYNPTKQQYEGAWIENMSPQIAMSTGTYDEASQTWTFKGEMMDPMTGTMVETVTTVDTSDPDKETMEGFIVGPDGSREKNFEATFERAD